MPVQSFYGLPVKYAATGDALMTGNQSLILVPFAFDENKCTEQLVEIYREIVGGQK